jgi:chromosomal replication initiator protein
VVAYCEFHKIFPSLENVEKILSELIENNKKSLQTEDIFKVISEFYTVSQEDLIKKGRKKEVSHPRQVMMYLLRQELALPFSTIGEILGGRDHTTALHAFEKINTQKEVQTRLKEELNSLKEKLYYS